MGKLLLDDNGYKQFIEELEKLKALSDKSAVAGSDAYDSAVGDGWHDNFAFEESMRESRLIAKRIDDMYDQKKNIKIIEDNKTDKNTVNLNDKVLVEITYSEDDKEQEIVILTGKYIPDIQGGIKEITINSPIGKTIYKAKVGTTQKYKVDDREIQIRIISKQ